MGHVTTMHGGTGKAAAGRAALMGVLAALLACAVGILLAAGPARADEAGYFTLSGVVGLDEGTAYATLAEAVGALASCDAAAQQGSPQSASILVHGTVGVGAGEAHDLLYPVDGSTVALVGSGDGARIAVADGGSLALTNAAGSLVVRGIAFSGAVSLTSRDNLMVEASSFDRGVVCRAGGSVGVSGNVFAAASAGPGAAFSATLAGDGATLSFTGNEVAGFGCGVAVDAVGAFAAARVTSNHFLLVSGGAGGTQDRSSAVRLAGGAWGAASVACDGNGVFGADVPVVLDATFSTVPPFPEGAGVRSVAADDVDAPSIAAVFELIGGGSSPEGAPLVGLDSAFDGTRAAEAAARAFAPAEEPPVPAEAALSAVVAQEDAAAAALPEDAAASESAPAAAATVTYDANGATAGVAPSPLSAPVGSSVTAETMGSLVYAGCVFEGWNTAADGSGSFYAAGQVFSLQEDTVLYAQWTPTGTVATVTVSSGTERPATEGVA